MKNTRLKPTDWCKEKIKQAEASGNWSSAKDYNTLLTLWKERYNEETTSSSGIDISKYLYPSE